MLIGFSPGTITQAFATTPGSSYTLAFEYANNIGVSTATATVSVLDSSDSTLLSQNISHSGSTRANMNYTPFSGSFVADTTETTLQFAATNPGNGGIALDAVSVSPGSSAIPEPASAVLAIIGGLMVLGYGWSQRKTKLAA